MKPRRRNNRGSLGRVANGNDAEGTIPWQVILNVKRKFAQVSIFFMNQFPSLSIFVGKKVGIRKN